MVHNITDRPTSGVSPVAVRFGPDKIRPGKHAMVDEALLKKKHRELHGTYIWIGQLPSRLTRNSKSGLKVKSRALMNDGTPAMTVQEARAYLEDMDEAELLDLCESIVPPLVFPVTPSKRVIIARLGRVLFMDRVLDPEKFFWLRRWVKKGETFIERE
jgi:hypothetical protein